MWSSSSSARPLFSTILSFSALVLLYFPRLLWSSLLSPPLLLAGVLFFSLLRLGVTQRQIQSNLQLQSISNHPLHLITEVSSEACTALISCSFEESFVQWNVRAPLEVIYEDFDEEEEEGEKNDKDDPEAEQVGRMGSVERYKSLSLYYPETDSDSSSVDEMENVCFMWDEEDDDREELIEISLDMKKPSELFQLEEENLIEIDISPTAFPVFNITV